MSNGDVAARLARLEAIQAIEQLKALYCLYCDRGYQPDAIASLFTEDAVWDGGADRGRYVGRAAIRAFFAEVSGRFPFAAHLVTNPIIDVNGERATGLWRMLMPCTVRDSDREVSAIQVAEYDETYRYVDDRWLIERLSVKRRRAELPGSRWDAR
jgi:hypothetical protein